MKTLLCALAFLSFAVSSMSAMTVDGPFTDHMVLQRDLPIPVSGTAAPGEKITVSFADQTQVAVADQEGKWRVVLAALTMSSVPATLTVQGEGAKTFKDVLVGDVWMCAGQSNMEMNLGSCNAPSDIREAKLPLVRQFFLNRTAKVFPQSKVSGKWHVCTPQSAPGFIAAGFYFARKVQGETAVPIGIINATWGGTIIEAWTPMAGLALVPELADIREKNEKKQADFLEEMNAAFPDYAKALSMALAAGTQPPTYPAKPEPKFLTIRSPNPHDWHCIYNGSVHPVTRFPIKGILWYQGEHNGEQIQEWLGKKKAVNGDSYLHKMRALVASWRKAWGLGDIPFYFVQLCSFRKANNDPASGDGWAMLRMAQLEAMSAIPNTGMASAIDLADPDNPGEVHFHNKKDVGERLALWALARDYGKKDLVHSGPAYKSMTMEGGVIRLAFDHRGSGLMVGTKSGLEPAVRDPSGKLKRFAIAGEDRKWVWAEAVIDGATVLVSSPSVPKPVAVRYAFAINPEGFNLYNNEGLPASPFRTDRW